MTLEQPYFEIATFECTDITYNSESKQTNQSRLTQVKFNNCWTSSCRCCFVQNLHTNCLEPIKNFQNMTITMLMCKPPNWNKYRKSQPNSNKIQPYVPSDRYAHLRQSVLQLSGHIMELQYPVKLENENENDSELAIFKWTIGGMRGILVIDLKCEHELHQNLRNNIHNRDNFDQFKIQNGSELLIYFHTW